MLARRATDQYYNMYDETVAENRDSLARLSQTAAVGLPMPAAARACLWGKSRPTCTHVLLCGEGLFVNLTWRGCHGEIVNVNDSVPLQQRRYCLVWPMYAPAAKI